MTRARKFDWDEAKRLRAAGWSYQRIADQLGVTKIAVRDACDDAIRAARNESHRRWVAKNLDRVRAYNAQKAREYRARKKEQRRDPAS